MAQDKADRLERRSLEGLEVRKSDGGVVRIGGYAAVYNVEANIAGLFREVVRPGAFAAALEGRQGFDVVAWYQHGRGAPLPLGRTSAKTLRLWTDDRGLLYEVDLPNTQAALDLVESIRRGDVTSSSFAFDVLEEAWHEVAGELPFRELLAVELFDVSPVVRAAYTETSVGLRSAEQVFSEWASSPDRQAPAAEGQARAGEQQLAGLELGLGLLETELTNC